MPHTHPHLPHTTPHTITTRTPTQPGMLPRMPSLPRPQQNPSEGTEMGFGEPALGGERRVGGYGNGSRSAT
eukprot:554266-Rhodomonas_salina.1